MIYLALAVPFLVAAALAGLRRRGSDWRRLAPVVGAAGAVLVGWSLIGLGQGTGIDWPVVVVGAPALAFVVTARARPAPAPIDRWTGAVADRGAVNESGILVPSSAAAVARSLGRVESRELVRSPWFGVGVGFCVLLFVLFGIVFAADTPTWAGFFELAPWLAHPLVGLTVLACHHAVTRDRRDHADELFASCPTTSSTRTAGFLLAAPVPPAALVTMFAALTAAVLVNSDDIHGPVGLDSASNVAAGIVLGAGGVALGVALGRWARFGLVPLVAVVAVAMATLSLNGVGGNAWHPVTMLSTAPSIEDVSPIFQDRPVWWHLAWVSALVVLVALLAVGRHHRSRAVAVAALVTVAASVATGVGATRPMPTSSAQRIAALISEPEAHQECVRTAGPVQICGFPYHRDLLERVAARVRPVSGALPDHLPPLILRQTYDHDLDDLPPEVRRLLTAGDLDRPAREVRLGFGSELADVAVDPGFAIAFAALDIPHEADEQRLPTVVAGQARGVVAIWLATRSLDADDTARASTSPSPGSADAFERGSLELTDACSVPAVVWSAEDLAAARSVLALPETDVRAAITEEWDHWIDPSTGTAELLAALGLPDQGPYDRVEARPGQGC